MLPPTILTEAVAQVGAILILSKPENREKLTFFMGIEKVRYRQPVRPGDVVEIEAVVKRLRSRVGILQRRRHASMARSSSKGTMTFALGPRGGNPTSERSQARSPERSVRRAERPQDRAHLQRPRVQAAQRDSGLTYRHVSSTAGARSSAPTQVSATSSASAIARVSRSYGPKVPKAAVA